MNQMFNEILSKEEELLKLTLLYYEKHIFFTWQWWFLLVLLIAPWIIWWKLVDRKKLVEISLFGFYVLLFVIVSDVFGVTYGLWNYPIGLIPASGFSITADLSMFAVSHMLVYQYFPKWKGFIIAHLIYAFVFAFIIGPLAIWLDLYVNLEWEHIYSFFIYFGKAMIGKCLVDKILSLKEGV